MSKKKNDNYEENKKIVKAVYFDEAALQGNIHQEFDKESKRLIEKQINNTILTDYLASVKDNIKPFKGIVYAPENSMK